GDLIQRSGSDLVGVSTAELASAVGGELAPVATSGNYADLSGRPTLGSAASADTADFPPSSVVSQVSNLADVVDDLAGDVSDLAAMVLPHLIWAGSAWPARPESAPVVMFISTHDASATAPNDLNLAVGDVWLRHPEAVDTAFQTWDGDDWVPL